MLVSGIWVYSKKDNLTQFVLEELNANLTAKVSINDLSVDFFKQFPEVSIDMHQVHISEPGKPKFTLLHAAHIYASFNIYDIITDNYTIRQVLIDSGYCKLHRDITGNGNYSIFKTSNDTTESLFNLNKISINNIQLYWQDDLNKQEYSGFITEAMLNLNKSSNEIKLQGNTIINGADIRSDHLMLIRQKELAAEIELLIDLKNKKTTLLHTELSINGTPFNISGSYNYSGNNFIDLTAESKKSEIQTLLSLLPVRIPDAFKIYKSTGNISFIASLRGDTKNKLPDLSIKFGISNGSFTEPETGAGFNQILTEGSFKHLLSSAPELTIDHFKASSQGGKFEGDLQVVFQKVPEIKLNVNGELPIPALMRFIPANEFKVQEGFVKGNLTVNGNINELNTGSGITGHTSGTIQFSLSKLTRNNENFINEMSGEFSLNGSDLFVKNWILKTEKSNLTLEGNIKHLFPWIFNRSGLSIDIACHASQLDGSEFIFSNDTSTNSRSNISVLLDLKADHFKYRLFQTEQLSAKVALYSGNMRIDYLSCNTMGGTIQISGELEEGKENTKHIHSNCKLNNINIKELFKQCGEFGQNEITSSHLDGIVNGKVELISMFDKDWNCISSNTHAVSDITISNGEIKNYKPLESLSRFADVEDLRNLKFAELHNQITISKGVITIPEMEVINNALNLTLSGTHTFDQQINYRLKIKLKELLAGKRKAKGNEFGEEEENGKGIYLYISVKGTASSPVMSYDKLAVRNKINADLSKEKENIKEIFRKEFGTSKDSLIKEKNNNSDELEFEKD